MDERGSVSLVAVGLIVLTAILALLFVDLLHVVAAKGSAQTAADAAALAAAQELVIPSDRSPADVAAEYVAINGGQLVSCRCDPGTTEAVVVVARTVTLPFLGGNRTLHASARAVVGTGGEVDRHEGLSLRAPETGDAHSRAVGLGSQRSRWCGFARSAPMADIEVRESGGRVAVAADDRVVIRLPENATTGYQWTIDDMPSSLEVERNEMIPPGSAAPGAAGERLIVLRATGAGTSQVRLGLRRTWDPAQPPLQTFETEIEIS
jgi:inhibitor of cysteine peptidase